MSYILKGAAGAVAISKRYEYDMATGDYYFTTEYNGSQTAIIGIANSLRQRSSFDSHITEGKGFVSVKSPAFKTGTTNEVEVRYEIATEVVEKEIWEHPAIIAASEAYDALPGLTIDDDSFKEICEQAAATAKTFAIPDPMATIANQVVRMIKNGITGWEYEYVTLRRWRRIPNISAALRPSLVAFINQTQYYYTTEQLDLPNEVAFNVPDTATLSARNQYSAWGWRRRPSETTYDGQWIEQRGEFLLAEWDKLLYSASPDNADW